MQTQSRSKGFTLVEILVALAITSVLAAMLFTVFGRVRENGRATTCRSNLKQLALAAQLYAQDNDGRIPALLIKEVLASYIKNSLNSELFICPTQNRLEDNNKYYYNTNGYLADWSISPSIGLHETRVQNPSLTWLQTDMMDLGHTVTIKPAQGAPCGDFTDWHSGGANYSFVDGHVKWMLPEPACALWNQSRSP